MWTKFCEKAFCKVPFNQKRDGLQTLLVCRLQGTHDLSRHWAKDQRAKITQKFCDITIADIKIAIKSKPLNASKDIPDYMLTMHHLLKMPNVA